MLEDGSFLKIVQNHFKCIFCCVCHVFFMFLNVLEFTANYDATDYATIAALTGEQYFAVWFGVNSSDQPDGNAGKFEFKGEITCWVAGGSVEAAVDMGIAITTSTEITKA